MTRELADAMRLDTPALLTVDEVVELSGLAESLLRELVEYGALDPVDRSEMVWRFESRVVVTARTASRLQRELELDAYALAVVLGYVDEMRSLQREVRRLRAMLGR